MSLQPWGQSASERARLLARLSADPATQPQLRASDADRDVVREALNQAFATGRINHEEHLERLDQVSSSRTVGELFTLVDDLVTDRPVPAPSDPPLPVRARRGAALVRTGRSWLFVAVITNAIWFLTGWGYYWPIWPMFGMAIPVLAVLLFGSGGTQQGGGPELTRAQQRELRDQRRGERRGR